MIHEWRNLKFYFIQKKITRGSLQTAWMVRLYGHWMGVWLIEYHWIGWMIIVEWTKWTWLNKFDGLWSPSWIAVILLIFFSSNKISLRLLSSFMHHSKKDSMFVLSQQWKCDFFLFVYGCMNLICQVIIIFQRRFLTKVLEYFWTDEKNMLFIRWWNI